eukprot:TRINITY_DN82771_c0_g1_i1.p1 TRINITY_DN82771_c0_g1~~TRINITY_DN82771_c0_g1_i1.p1  ORF type:complete len:343 (-),score=93.03 TRINITY_DN82771_c0_g1_i1:98-1126(-)
MTDLEGIVFGAGNPLLDISAVVPESFLTKYGLKPGNAILASEAHLPIYEELVNSFSPEYVAGGATQNSIRVCQWMMQVPKGTTYIGCVGKDEFAGSLRKAAGKDGMRAAYMEVSDTPTGTCAVCIVGKERSMVANLGAANKYSIDHLLSPAIQELVERARIFYSASFFLTVSPDSLHWIAKHAAEKKKMFCLNLSATFLIDLFGDEIARNMPFVDLLFANDDEARFYAKKNGMEGMSLRDLALKLAQSEKTNVDRKRIVCFTQGKDPTIVATPDGVEEYPVPPIDPSLIVDTNGAGDSFVGGFLSQLAVGKGITECIRAGHYAASVVIQHSGCTFPEKPDFV